MSAYMIGAPSEVLNTADSFALDENSFVDTSRVFKTTDTRSGAQSLNKAYVGTSRSAPMSPIAVNKQVRSVAKPPMTPTHKGLNLSDSTASTPASSRRSSLSMAPSLAIPEFPSPMPQYPQRRRSVSFVEGDEVKEAAGNVDPTPREKQRPNYLTAQSAVKAHGYRADSPQPQSILVKGASQGSGAAADAFNTADAAAATPSGKHATSRRSRSRNSLRAPSYYRKIAVKRAKAEQEHSFYDDSFVEDYVSEAAEKFAEKERIVEEEKAAKRKAEEDRLAEERRVKEEALRKAREEEREREEARKKAEREAKELERIKKQEEREHEREMKRLKKEEEALAKKKAAEERKLAQEKARQEKHRELEARRQEQEAKLQRMREELSMQRQQPPQYSDDDNDYGDVGFDDDQQYSDAHESDGDEGILRQLREQERLEKEAMNSLLQRARSRSQQQQQQRASSETRSQRSLSRAANLLIASDNEDDAPVFLRRNSGNKKQQSTGRVGRYFSESANPANNRSRQASVSFVGAAPPTTRPQPAAKKSRAPAAKRSAASVAKNTRGNAVPAYAVAPSNLMKFQSAAPPASALNISGQYSANNTGYDDYGDDYGDSGDDFYHKQPQNPRGNARTRAAAGAKKAKPQAPQYANIDRFDDDILDFDDDSTHAVNVARQQKQTRGGNAGSRATSTARKPPAKRAKKPKKNIDPEDPMAHMWEAAFPSPNRLATELNMIDMNPVQRTGNSLGGGLGQFPMGGAFGTGMGMFATGGGGGGNARQQPAFGGMQLPASISKKSYKTY